MTKRKSSKSSKSGETNRNENRNETHSEITVETQKLQDKASRSTENIFSRMLSRSSK